MKAKSIFFIFLLLPIFGNNIFAKFDTLIVKFKSKNHISKFNTEISKYLEIIEIKPLINDRLLDFRVIQNKYNATIYVNRISELSNSLRLNYLVVFKLMKPKEKIKQLLNKSALFTYIEDYPNRSIVVIPNDSLYSEQYYMELLGIPQSWDSLTTKREIVVGVVDTGVDYTHPDLQSSIWVNPEEDGIDEFGNSKRENNIDDDENGFVDDWRGWDFMSSDSSGYDNDPIPGHGHGTHVSGTIAATINNFVGIAGVCDSIKILPVKVGDDSPFSTSVRNSYEGILYAAKMGADLINCSWGGNSNSITEQEVIELANELGSLVIAAAGNNNSNAQFFPASYPKVLSVAATDFSDFKAYFSNYNSSVDISAPGVSILSTIPGNEYASWQGTSMATPIVVGIAAMVKMKYPNYSNSQISAHLKATSKNIDTFNLFYIGKIGKGRIDAFSALTSPHPKDIELINSEIIDSDKNGRFESNESCSLSLELFNYLTDINDLRIEILSEFPDFSVEPKLLKYGKLLSQTGLVLDKLFSFDLPEFSGLDLRFELWIKLYDGDTLINTYTTSIFVNPSYLVFDNNKISTTFNSRGNIAYNDYSSNEQGNGFSYQGSPNILYEGSLMIARDTMLADVARGISQSRQNRGFRSTQKLDYLPYANPTLLGGLTKFISDTLNSNFANLEVIHTIHQNTIPNNVIYSIYDIVNHNNYALDSVYVGLYYDWDIGISGTDNYTYWDFEKQYAVVQNAEIDTLPLIGIKQLTNFKDNFWAIDNDGVAEENPGVWDGFEDIEKIKMLKSGIGRKQSLITDVSVVSSAGPIYIDRNDTVRVTFAIFASDNIMNLNNSIDPIVIYAQNSGFINGEYNKPINSTKLVSVFPNPIKRNEEITIQFQLSNEMEIEIYLADFLGRKIETYINGKYEKNKYIYKTQINNLANAAYFIVLKANNNISAFPIIINE
jgi:hypothetical protein